MNSIKEKLIEDFNEQDKAGDLVKTRHKIDFIEYVIDQTLEAVEKELPEVAHEEYKLVYGEHIDGSNVEVWVPTDKAHYIEEYRKEVLKVIERLKDEK